MSNSVSRRRTLLIGGAVVMSALLAGLVVAFLLEHRQFHFQATATPQTDTVTRYADNPRSADLEPTLVYAHNLMLRKGPDFRIYIVWIAGKLVRTHEQINPSFDDPDSFVLHIDKGVIHVNIGDLTHFMNQSMGSSAPLKNLDIQPASELPGSQVRIRGTVKKLITMPVEILGDLSATPEGLVRLHVDKISVLKMPMKGLLKMMDVKIADLVHTSTPGMRVVQNDIVFDTEKLLPPPHIHGQLTTVRVKAPDIEVIYGNAPVEPSLAQWHNFLRFRNGAVDFGKLTMHHVDLTMIDTANEPWFDLDLVNYQSQLVNGYTRMTAQAGLEIYMPSLKEGSATQPKAARSVTLEWLKNRNASLPPDIASKTGKP